MTTPIYGMVHYAEASRGGTICWVTSRSDAEDDLKKYPHTLKYKSIVETTLEELQARANTSGKRIYINGLGWIYPQGTQKENK